MADHLFNEDIQSMDVEEIEELREKLSEEYFSGTDERHHHLTAREKTIVRDKLIRLHKELTQRGETPKRIER